MRDDRRRRLTRRLALALVLGLVTTIGVAWLGYPLGMHAIHKGRLDVQSTRRHMFRIDWRWCGGQYTGVDGVLLGDTAECERRTACTAETPTARRRSIVHARSAEWRTWEDRLMARGSRASLRWLRQICACLLLGVATTYAVAWGSWIALCSGLTPVRPCGAFPADPYVVGNLRGWRALGVEWQLERWKIVFEPRHVRRWRKTWSESPPWVPRPVGVAPAAGRSTVMQAHAMRAGWPRYAVACTWLEITELRNEEPLRWNGPCHVFGGLRVPLDLGNRTMHSAYDDVVRRTLPIRPIWPGFLINVLTFSVSSLALLMAPGMVRVLRSRGREYACPNCGYELSATPQGRPCPECGDFEVARLSEPGLGSVEDSVGRSAERR